MKSPISTQQLDLVGSAVSVLCALHCALTPIVLTLAPLSGAHIWENPLVEYSALGISFLIGSITLSIGYFKHHRVAFPMYWFLGGFTFVVIGHQLEDVGQISLLGSVIGAFFIAIAHITNRRY